MMLLFLLSMQNRLTFLLYSFILKHKYNVLSHLVQQRVDAPHLPGPEGEAVPDDGGLRQGLDELCDPQV